MTNTSAVPEAAPAQANSKRGHCFACSTSLLETLRNVGYSVSHRACLDEPLKTAKAKDEGDAEASCAAWRATAIFARALRERAQHPLNKDGACVCASTYHRTAKFSIPSGDPMPSESFRKTVNHASNFSA